MSEGRLMLLAALVLGVTVVRTAAQEIDPAAHTGHGGAVSKPALRSQSDASGPLLPEGMTLDEILDYAAKPPPASFGEPVHDDAVFSFTLFELLEYRVSDTGRDELGWDAQGWLGTDDHKFWWKTEGDLVFDGPDEGDADVQLLYATPVTAFWYLQVGVQFAEVWEPGDNDERFAGVLGLQGLAPFQWDLEPALFITDDADVLAQLTASYALYITQRLVLQPRIELRASAQDVLELGLGAGINDGNFDLRLRYEISREFAPYVGVRYKVLFGETADIAERLGAEDRDVQLLVGFQLAF